MPQTVVRATVRKNLTGDDVIQLRPLGRTGPRTRWRDLLAVALDGTAGDSGQPASADESAERPDDQPVATEGTP
jgi:hypothetical protein